MISYFLSRSMESCDCGGSVLSSCAPSSSSSPLLNTRVVISCLLKGTMPRDLYIRFHSCVCPISSVGSVRYEAALASTPASWYTVKKG